MDLESIYDNLYDLFNDFLIFERSKGDSGYLGLGPEILSVGSVSIPVFCSVRKIKILKKLNDEIATVVGGNATLDLADGRFYVTVNIPASERRELRLSDVLEKLKRIDLNLYLQKPLTLCFGVNTLGQLSLVNLGSASFPHLLISGSSGSGKTCLTQSLITQTILRDPGQEISFVIYSPKVADFRNFQHIQALKYGQIISSMRDLEYCLKDLYRIMDSRSKISKAKSPIIIILDEVGEVLKSDKAKEMIEAIAMRGRSESLILVLICQSGKKSNLFGSNALRENITLRAVLRAESKRESTILTNNSDLDASKLGLGEAYLISGARWQRIWTPIDNISTIYNVKDIETKELDPGDDEILSIDNLQEASDERERILSIPEELRDQIVDIETISKAKISNMLGVASDKACQILRELEALGLLGEKEAKNKPSPINKEKLTEIMNRYPDLFSRNAGRDRVAT